MLNAVYLISIILGVSSQDIFKKPYTNKVGGKGVYWFSGTLSIAALLFFVVTSKGLQFEMGILPYALGFAATYIITMVFSVKAISCGPLSLTALFSSYSLMLPAFYGLFFLREPIGVGFIPGIILLMISLFLINKKSDNNKISFKWVIYVFLVFVGNGMCSVFQKMQQTKYDGAYKSEFMIVSLGMVAIAMLVFALVDERKDFRTFCKGGWYWAALCGLMNGIVNLLVMILSGRMLVSLMFPLVSSGGIIVTYVVSRFVYKEKLTKIQFVGFLIGIATVVCLNL